ncbi:hypothetical protein BSNT_06633 [Bacillus subtilis subsp. natto BEST195]|nr:hypothetical protein BSNT_06633 [Bacillus subtilis subsp. natto BEST195]
MVTMAMITRKPMLTKKPAGLIYQTMYRTQPQQSEQ